MVVVESQQLDDLAHVGLILDRMGAGTLAPRENRVLGDPALLVQLEPDVLGEEVVNGAVAVQMSDLAARQRAGGGLANDGGARAQSAGLVAPVGAEAAPEPPPAGAAWAGATGTVVAGATGCALAGARELAAGAAELPDAGAAALLVPNGARPRSSQRIAAAITTIPVTSAARSWRRVGRRCSGLGPGCEAAGVPVQIWSSSTPLISTRHTAILKPNGGGARPPGQRLQPVTPPRPR